MECIAWIPKSIHAFAHYTLIQYSVAHLMLCTFFRFHRLSWWNEISFWAPHVFFLLFFGITNALQSIYDKSVLQCFLTPSENRIEPKKLIAYMLIRNSYWRRDAANNFYARSRESAGWFHLWQSLIKQMNTITFFSFLLLLVELSFCAVIFDLM